MTNNKKPCHDFVHEVRFWKGQRFSNETSTRLPQSVIPTLHVVCLPAAFANTRMGLFRKDKLISFPEIAVTLASLIRLWNLLPELAATRLAVITDNKGHDLTSATAHDRPDPAFVPSFVDKWPHFIGFQHICRFGWQKRLFKFRIGFVFFLARRLASDDSHQKCVGYRAYWSVHGRQTRSVLFALPCIHVSVREHHVFRNLCTSIVDCHSHCDHFSRCFGSHNFDICKPSVLLSCSNYTTNHFNFTTTRKSKDGVIPHLHR